MHWIVDAMNVIGSRPDGWWRDRQRAMTDLVARLEAWTLTTEADVTVVFERQPVPPIPTSRVTIAHAPRARANAADDEIVRLVEAHARPVSVCVVTSDRELAARVRALGASVEPASRFRTTIDAAGGAGRS